MKNFIIIVSILISLASCQSKSYYAAESTNLKRFDGWEEDNAKFLLAASDRVMLLNNLSDLALLKAELKDTYLITNDALETYQEIHTAINFEAVTKRVKLANTLSNESNAVYQKLNEMGKENFDAFYKETIIKEIAEFDRLAEDYKKNGKNENLRELSRKIQTKLEIAKETISELDIS